jgi:hypothetical protein
MRRLTALIIAVVVLLPGPVSADVKVRPLPNSPHLSLKGTKIIRDHRPPAPQPIVANPVDEPLWEPIDTCRVDPAIGIYGCSTEQPAEPEEDERPEPTPGDVLRAVRKIGLPSLQVQVQPGGKTLVNVPTIFYAEPQPFERSVELLGFDVDLVAEPVSYHWVHGDGSEATTTQPGRPYPAMDVTHRYTTPAKGVQARVDVTYRVRFRIDGAAWSTLGQTLVASGPPAALDVKEAAPVLTTP